MNFQIAVMGKEEAELLVEAATLDMRSKVLNCSCGCGALQKNVKKCDCCDPLQYNIAICCSCRMDRNSNIIANIAVTDYNLEP